MTVGKRIRERRKIVGLTQAQLADTLGISPQAVSEWERDEGAPERDRVPEVASVLQTSSAYILGEAEIGPHNDLMSLLDRLAPPQRRLAIASIRGMLAEAAETFPKPPKRQKPLKRKNG